MISLLSYLKERATFPVLRKPFVSIKKEGKLKRRAEACHHCRDNNIEECGLEMFFSVDFELLGEIKPHELKPGGGDIRVTEENKVLFFSPDSSWSMFRFFSLPVRESGSVSVGSVCFWASRILIR
jgi:hypothetical protein